MIIRAIIIVLLVPAIAYAGRAGGSANISTFISVGDLNSAQIARAVQIFDFVQSTVGQVNLAQVNIDATAWKAAGGCEFLDHNQAERPYVSGKECCLEVVWGEDIYAHYTDCEPSCGESDRITASSGLRWLADVTNTEWHEQVYDWYAEYNSDHDGLMLDDGAATVWEGSLDPGLPYGYSASAWKSAKDTMYTSVKTELGSKKLIFNGWRSWGTDPNYGDAADGGMIENCIITTATDPDHLTTDHDWIEESVDLMFDSTAAGKIVLCLPKDESGSIFTAAQRLFALAAFLLANDPTYHYFHIFTRLDFQATWYPEYAINIGTPTGSPTSMADLENLDGLFVREYTNGIVVLNDTVGAIDYTLPTCMLSYAGSSSDGDIQGDGSLSGNLGTSIECGTVSVASGTAKIYKYKLGTVTSTGTAVMTSGGNGVLR